MRLTSKLLFALALIISVNSFATNEKKLSVSKLVDQYYESTEVYLKSFKSILNTKPDQYPPECEDQGPSCFDVICSKLGTYGCDDLDEVKKVHQACRGNYSGKCVSVVCDVLGTFSCDDMNETLDMARACVGNYNMECFESVCEKLGKLDCNDKDEVTEVLKSCAGN